MMATARSAPLSRTSRAVLLVLGSMACFALMDGLSKIVAATVPIPQMLWIRNIVFTLVAIALVRWDQPGVPLRQLATSARPGLQLARGLLLLVESSMFIWAFMLMPIADAHAIAAAAPLFVVAMSAMFLGEQVGPRRWAAVIVGFIGVLLIVRPGFGSALGAAASGAAGTPMSVMLVPLGGAVLWALYQVMARLASRVDRPATTSLWTAMVGLGVTSALGPFYWIWPDATTWALLLAIALLGSAAHVTLITALGMADASSLQPFTYTLFIWAVVVGFGLFGDIPGMATWSGAAVIIASGIYIWWRERVRAGEAQAIKA